jgi:hypothetical protein
MNLEEQYEIYKVQYEKLKKDLHYTIKSLIIVSILGSIIVVAMVLFAIYATKTTLYDIMYGELMSYREPGGTLAIDFFAIVSVIVFIFVEIGLIKDLIEEILMLKKLRD